MNHRTRPIWLAPFIESHDFCPRCGFSEALHPEACDITPAEWEAAVAAVLAARRTRTTWRLIATVRAFGGHP